ncbi:helix-turn-helix domain-containing protein [Paractinoplanes atraurantiacus]|uniref:Helix-turn-helix domain-containing protein n=1 Tax=Paractinoplanes atraurantiacus TaxID=1036182 RepID=A0A285KBC5_9ACTN|nr:helix-turn-helix domain-containing protein [Actinoplanes atraurantiacus]SNY68621.1 Helix-turn-helix domain-containing protein [Actinoplanes atraurantiacus]
MTSGIIMACRWKSGKEKVLVSHTGHRLVRRTAFKFALDLTDEQERRCRQYAGAARLAYNHHIGRVKANIGQRAAEISYGIVAAELTPALSWSKVAFINAVSVSYERGRWWASVEGVAASFNRARRGRRPVAGVTRWATPPVWTAG